MSVYRVHIAGVHIYSVRIPEKPIYDEDGNALDGLSIESRRLILISPSVQPERREETLAHEVEHAWTWHVPRATDDESRCQLTATICQALRQDIDANGGIEALRDLKPEPISLPYKAAPTKHFAGPAATFFNTDRRYCGACDAQVMCGSIETSHPELHEGLGQYHVSRWFTCEICGALNCWSEISTSDGQPTGVLVQVPGPKMYRGNAAREWLKAHAPGVAV